MAALGHHPQHLRILVLAQTYGARVVIAVTIPRVVPLELEPGVGINHALVEPQRHVGLLVLLLVIRHENDTWQDNAVGGVGGGGVDGGCLGSVSGGAAAEVGREEEGGEEEEEGEGYGDGVAKAKVGELRGRGHGEREGRGRRRGEGGRRRRRREGRFSIWDG